MQQRQLRRTQTNAEIVASWQIWDNLILLLVVVVCLISFSLAGCSKQLGLSPTATITHSQKRPLNIASPTHTLTVIDPVLYKKFAQHFFELIVQHQYRIAYGSLSSDLQAHEPFEDFIKNPDYTLYQGCWRLIQIPVSQQGNDHRTWIVGIELARTSCVANCFITFYWLFHLQIIQDHPVIVRIGLYPTGTDC